MDIETFYKVQIDIQEDPEALCKDWDDKIEAKSFDITRRFKYMDWEVYRGPCFDFGIRLESHSNRDIEKAVASIVAYVNRFKGLKISS